VREYESQLFAQKNKDTPSHCKCPALKYPSRRDIIEESALTFFNSPLWEFKIWGMDRYIKETLLIDSNEIENISLKGKETKKNILLEKYFDYILNQLKSQEHSIPIDSYYSFDYTLDEIGINYLNTGIKKDLCGSSIPIPKLWTNEDLSISEKRMICTLGPFWGMIGLGEKSKQQILRLQEKLYSIHLDIGWGQTVEFLKMYYDGSKI
jgi:hypothetical protein